MPIRCSRSTTTPDYDSRLEVCGSAVVQGTRVHDCGGHGARTRHWREHGRVQPGEYAFLCATCLRQAARNGAALFPGQERSEKISWFFLSDLSRHPRAEHGLQRCNGFQPRADRLGQKGDTRRAFAAIVSSNYFSVLGVPLARGRAFLPEEETPGRNAPVAIVSYSYWQKHDLDPSVLGSQVTHQRPSVHNRRNHAERFRRHAADFVTGSLVADKRLRSGRERFWVEEQDHAWTIAMARSCASSGG